MNDDYIMIYIIVLPNYIYRSKYLIRYYIVYYTKKQPLKNVNIYSGFFFLKNVYLNYHPFIILNSVFAAAEHNIKP